MESTLFFIFHRWLDELEVTGGKPKFKLSEFKNQLLPLIQMQYTQVEDITEKRRLYKGHKINGLCGINCTVNYNKKSSDPVFLNAEYAAFNKYREENWWINLADLGIMNTDKDLPDEVPLPSEVQSAEEPVEELAEKPVEELAEKPAEEPAEKPAEEPAEELYKILTSAGGGQALWLCSPLPEAISKGSGPEADHPNWSASGTGEKDQMY